MLDTTLRWVASCLLILITLIFIHLGLAVISGQTNSLFEAFLQATWPQSALDEAASGAPGAREELAFTVINYGISALGAAWVACLAYLIVMRNQQRQAEQQLAIERLRLTAELDESILEIVESDSVYEIDAKGNVSRTKFLSACDRNTVWRDGTDRQWSYRGGERTVQFVESSKSVSASAEVSLSALHRYLGWIRRIARAVETHVLLEKDVLLFWRWVVIGCYRNRYPFLCSVFYRDDLQDFVRLVEQIVINGQKTGSGTDFVKYLRSVGDPALIAELSAPARAIVGVVEHPAAV